MIKIYKTVVHLYVITRTTKIDGKKKTVYLEQEDKFTNVSLWTINKNRAGVFYGLTAARYCSMQGVEAKKILSIKI